MYNLNFDHVSYVAIELAPNSVLAVYSHICYKAHSVHDFHVLG